MSAPPNEKAPAQLQLDEGRNETPTHQSEGITMKTTQSIVQLDACPKWCVGNCQDDYHHTDAVKIDTIEKPMSVQLTFGADDPEPIISIAEHFDTLLTADQAIQLAAALTELVATSKAGAQ